MHRDCSNLGIRQPLRNKHEPDSQAGYHVVEEPSIIVSRKPPDYGHLLKSILGSGPRKSASPLLTQSSRPVPVYVVFEVVFDYFHNFHDEEGSLVVLWFVLVYDLFDCNETLSGGRGRRTTENSRQDGSLRGVYEDKSTLSRSKRPTNSYTGGLEGGGGSPHALHDFRFEALNLDLLGR